MDNTVGSRGVAGNPYQRIVAGGNALAGAVPQQTAPATQPVTAQATTAGNRQASSFVQPLLRRQGSLGVAGGQSGAKQAQEQAAQAGYLAGLIRALPMISGVGQRGNG